VATDVSELRLNVRYDEGDGPPMVLLHGLNADATDWRPVIDTIGGGYRFIAVDHLGYGDSPKPLDIDYDTDQQVQILDATLVDAGVDQPFLLVGYSLGGDIAIRYASTYPHKVRRLFLLSAPFYLPPESFASDHFATRYLQVVVFQALWRLVSGAKKKDDLLYQLANGRAEEFAKAQLRSDEVPVRWDIMSKNLSNCIAKATFVDDLPKLDMPVTFALGIRDPIVHPDQTPDLKRLKPDIDIRRIVGLSADHFMLQNLPATVAEEIMRDEVRGLHVRYRAGQGAATVFLHGAGEDPNFWVPVATALSARGEVAAVDLLGFGESPKPLSSRYKLSDHADAVIRTLKREFAGRRVRLVGQEFGSTVALAVAAAAPQLVSDVVAFSPLLLEPSDAADGGDALQAEALATRERVRAMAGDVRSRAAVERSEERIVPLLRTGLNAVLAADPEQLLASVSMPTVIVMPDADDRVPRSYLKRLLADSRVLHVLEPKGVRWMPLEDPSGTVLLIDPKAGSAAEKAKAAPQVKPRAGLDAVKAAFTSASNQVMWRGLGLVVLGLWMLTLHSADSRLLAIGFAVWVLIEGISTVIGAIGLRRSGAAGWLPWLLIGVVSFGVAGLLLVSTRLNLTILAFAIMARALYVGVANLYVARNVAHTPRSRWILVFEGLLGVAIALAFVFGEHRGALLTKYVLAGYFIISGISGISYALANRKAIRVRVQRAIAGQANQL